MSENYVSSIVFKYGDTENVRRDVTALNEILGRQGATLLIDVIAEHVGNCAIKFKWDYTESKRVRDSLIDELREAINERI